VTKSNFPGQDISSKGLIGITPVGSTGCYSHTKLLNTKIDEVVKQFPENTFIVVQIEADHIQNKPLLEALSMPYKRAGTMCITNKMHLAKNQIDFTRPQHIKSVEELLVYNGDRTIKFYEQLPEDMWNGVQLSTIKMNIRDCVQHDLGQFQKTNIDGKEGIIIHDVNSVMKAAAKSATSFRDKVYFNSSCLSPDKVTNHTKDLLENSTIKMEIYNAAQNYVIKSPEKLSSSGWDFTSAVTSVVKTVEINCPEAYNHSNVQEALEAYKEAEKGQNIDSPQLEELISKVNKMTNANSAVIPKNSNVTKETQMIWRGEVGLSQNDGKQLKNEEFKPPYTPPL